MKRGTPRHPKVYDLMEELKCTRPEVLGYLELLWHFTAEMAPRGDIGRYSNARIEAAVDWFGRGKRPGAFVSGLIKCGWADEHATCRVVVHHWSDHCEDSVRKKLARAGQCFVEDGGKVAGQTSDKVAPLSGQSWTGSSDGGRLARGVGVGTGKGPGKGKGQGSAPENPPEILSPSSDFSDAAERMYAAHPKKRDLALVPQSLEHALAGGATLVEIEECHAAWATSEDWTKNNGRYCPSLAKWLSDRGYTRWPEGHVDPDAPSYTDNPEWRARYKENFGKEYGEE